MGAAIDYLSDLDRVAAAEHEAELLALATDRIQTIDRVKIIGTAPEKASVLSFVLDGVHAHDVGTIVDQEGVAIRTGHHCTQPVMDFFGIPGTARACFSFYNTADEVDALVRAVGHVAKVFG